MHAKFFKYMIVGSAVAMTVMVSSAFAQTNDVRQMVSRIHQLENQVQTLSRAVYKGERPPITSLNSADTTTTTSVGNTSLANFEVRLAALERQMRQITGQIEKQNYDIAQTQSQLKKSLMDIEMRLSGNVQNQALGQPTSGRAVTQTKLAVPPKWKLTKPAANSNYMKQNPTVKPLGVLKTPDLKNKAVTTTKPNVAVVTKTVSPEKMYETAFALVREAEYDKAEKQFSNFLKTYPEHTLASNAQYWLSETHYVRGDYSYAAKQFAKGYQKYPKSSKAPDNLLKLGVSLGRLDKKQDACLTFKQLKKEFPKNTGSVMRRLEQEEKRLGCE